MSDINKQIMKDFGARLQTLRKRQGLSQEELAFRCGLHRTYISDIERGARNVSLINIIKIAKALKTKPGNLLG